jgi:hypothetical protein
MTDTYIYFEPDGRVHWSNRKAEWYNGTRYEAKSAIGHEGINRVVLMFMSDNQRFKNDSERS